MLESHSIAMVYGQIVHLLKGTAAAADAVR